VTAPTHNAVDNVLRKFLELKGIVQTKTTPLRVSTDVAKVSEELRPYTCDAMMGKDINEHFDARKKAAKRIKDARLIFTTCIGAGLGLLRGESFDTVLVDEASQQTEPASLVPLTKGCEHAVLVGDHVQLRATVQMQSLVTDFDMSLFESLYGAADSPGLAKVMINVQYRMHRQICAVSSKEFYQERLHTAAQDDARPLPASAFPWPALPSGHSARMALIPCASPEDIGRKSKSNRGQALLCREVCSHLLSFSPGSTPATSLTVAVLTPYSRQRELLKQMLPKSGMLEISSIDGYQGREADVVVFVTTRCNVHGQLGFLSDMRRLNVTMTRAKAGVVIIGHKDTLCGGAESDTPSKQIWRRLLASCREM
ncbi:putative restrictase, partial [Macrophomina phaseolina]